MMEKARRTLFSGLRNHDGLIRLTLGLDGCQHCAGVVGSHGGAGDAVDVSRSTGLQNVLAQLRNPVGGSGSMG